MRLNQSILKEISPEYSLEGLMLKLKLQYFGYLIQRTDSLKKTQMLGKIEGGRRRGTTEDEIVGYKYHEFEQALEVGDGQGSLVCCNLWGCKESDFQFALIHGPNIPGSYAILFFTASDLASITSHIHNRVLFLL